MSVPQARNRISSYWENAPSPSQATVNVGDAERLASVFGGGAVAIYGLTRGSRSGLALAVAGGAMIYRGLTGHCLIYQALGLSTADIKHGHATSVPAGAGLKVEQSYTINRSPEELFRFWRNFENLPRFMKHLESVQTVGAGRSRWIARAPLGMKLEWEAEVIQEKPNELISWRSLEGSTVDSAGSVHFARKSGGRGTAVRIVMKYNPPAGKMGAKIASLFGEEAGQLIEDDLNRFKQIMEAGELPAGGTAASGMAAPSGKRDIVRQQSEDSFPASDAPSWTTGR